MNETYILGDARLYFDFEDGSTMRVFSSNAVIEHSEEYIDFYRSLRGSRTKFRESVCLGSETSLQVECTELKVNLADRNKNKRSTLALRMIRFLKEK